MERLPVKSSNIKSIGYDEITKTLEIEFTNSGVYQYKSVSVEVYDGFIKSDSKGKYFHAIVKTKFETIKIEEFCKCEKPISVSTNDGRMYCHCGKKIMIEEKNEKNSH